ncbi:MAG TPA: EAL domain-containing protein [Candidatus Elarobacter sp.]|nr:EAL domain-containing protein [Candidatus Elarobacter sp.]
MTLAQPKLPIHVVAVGLTVVAAVATLPAAHVAAPDAGLAVPMGMIVATVAELATCAILVVLYAREPRLSLALLAAVYLAVAALGCAYATAVPLGPGLPSLVPVGAQVAISLFIAKWTICAGCLLGYAYLRRKEADTLAERAVGWPIRPLLVSAVATAAVIAAIVRFADRLPTFVNAEDMLVFDAGALRSSPSPIGLTLLLACLAAVIAVFAMRIRNGVDAGVTVTAVAVLLEVVLGFVDGRRFVIGWYVARLLCVPASMYVLVGALHDLLRWRARAMDLAGQLAGEHRRADRHSRRLESLWKLASQPALDDEAFLRAVLDEASSAMLPGADLTGAVSHLDGPDIVIDVARQAGGHSTVPVGARVPIEQTFLAEVLRAGGTRSWSSRAPGRPRGLWHIDGQPWQGFIGTSVRVGSTQYFLSFVTAVPMAEPFSPEDHAYVETVAAFCAMRLQQREQVQRLQQQSSHDHLTGLPNRFAFRLAANEALASDGVVAITVADVDRFGELNETLGHRAADQLLNEIGAALSARVSDRDLVARIGGDVFAVMLRDCKDHADVARCVERLFSAFAMPFAIHEAQATRVAITAAIGVAVAPQDGTDFERLMARAGGALQTAKAAGGARYAFFDPRVEDAFARARRLQNDLARALVRNEFVLYFQPHVAIATGRVTGAEALIRWNHPERGLLPPAEFIPFAEEHGMLEAIGPWVLRETVRAARAWRNGDPHFRVWFNLSASELHAADLPARLRAVEERFPGVGVEITESSAMRDVQDTARNLGVLRDAGMQIALDDFGTGYSSLARLRRLPIDVVKIDRSFTSGLPDDPHDVAIVEAVLGLARGYGFQTIAEGVETERQASYLERVGCPIAQGYLYAPPLPENAFAGYLRASRNRSANPPYYGT